MTYEERQQYRELRERLEALREHLQEGEAEEPVTRGEFREMLELMEVVVDRLSPERWDHAMGVIADEAARRAGAMAASRGP